MLQNGRWDNAVINPKPDYLSAGKMNWQHVRALIFDAGNEYRKFEFLDTDHPTMGIDAIVSKAVVVCSIKMTRNAQLAAQAADAEA